MLFLCLSFAVPSTTRPLLFLWRRSVLRKHPVDIGEKFGWIRFQPRDVHKYRLLLDSNKEGILSIALLELFRITRITLHCPFHESSLSIRHWMGCRRYFAANRLEVLVDENDSRSSSRVREHGNFLLVSQLHVAIQTLWSQCLFPRPVWTNRWIVHFQRVSPFLLDLRLRFRLRLCLDLNVQQTLALNWKQVSLFWHWCFRIQARRLLISSAFEPDGCSANTSLPVLTIGFWFMFGFAASLYHLQQLLNPILSSNYLKKRSNWHIHFLVNDFSSFHHDSLGDTMSWKRVVKDDCVRSCL